MGRITGVIGKLLSFVRVEKEGVKVSDVKIDLGGGEIVTAHFNQPSGDDAFPLVGDQPCAIPIARSGRYLVVAFVETDALQKALEGDKRIYARKADRTEAVELWLKNDGTATLDNENGSCVLSPDGSTKGTSPNGSFELRADGSHRTENSNGFIELQADGTVNINGTTINPAGDVESPTTVIAPSIVADGKEITDHDHAINSGSSAPGPTGTNNP